MNHALTHSFKAAKSLTAHHAKSFYFSSFPLPLAKRQAAFAVYAFCRFADDLVDEENFFEVLPLTTFESRMDFLEQLLNLAYVTSKEETLSILGSSIFPLQHLQWFPAFKETCHRFQIPKSYFDDLLVGLRMDIGFKGIADETHLSLYCYHVAGVVGLIMTRVFQMNEDHNSEAIALGEAMQLTNIVRDIREDYSLRKRIYVPQSVLQECSLSNKEFSNLASPNASLRDAQTIWPVVQRLTTSAKLKYDSAEKGLAAIPRDGSRFCAELMLQTYRGILEKVEKRGSPALFERQKLSFFRKLEKIPVAIYRQNFSQS